MINARLLVISLDEKLDRKLAGLLSRSGYHLSELKKEDVGEGPLPISDAVLLNCGKQSFEAGRTMLEKLKARNEGIPVVFLGRTGRLDQAVEIMKEGAADCLQIPPNPEKLKLSIDRAVQTSELTKRVRLLETQVSWDGKFDGIIGLSPQMQDIFHMIQTVAKSTATVLILGESGTGKELVAKALHRHSDRSQNKFIDINCGAIPKELLENELFGHERGAFTGADRQYIGSCERATGGTLFLDEVSEMDPSLQVKLLRVLQERCIVRVGGSERIDIDIRVIAATNRDLRAEVDKDHFREDLYYRLNVVPLHIPPLRMRREDVPSLAQYFLEKYSEENARRFKGFMPDAMEALINYDWPGNVRELENNIERIVVLQDDTRVRKAHLPRFIINSEKKVDPESAGWDREYQKILPLHLVEQYAIENALKRCHGDVLSAAKKLEIGQATLYRKVKKYGIKVD